MEMTQSFLRGLLGNIGACFYGYNLLWHVLAISLTAALVLSGADWRYFEATRGGILLTSTLPAAILGFFVPILVPVALYTFGEWRRNSRMMLAGVATAQAGLAALLITSVYKAFTGRMQPEFYTHLSTVDISRSFQFGFLEHGVFWGWPSSHTAVAFAGAVALAAVYPKLKGLRFGVLLYAAYIGLGVSVSIHWFSDAVAGMIIGSLVGYVTAARTGKTIA
jgi:membrane-associated phospholipid phosphatase